MKVLYYNNSKTKLFNGFKLYNITKPYKRYIFRREHGWIKSAATNKKDLNCLTENLNKILTYED